MTACRIETRSCSFWGSFSLAMSRQSWRNRSTLYMKTGYPPNRDIFLQDEAQWNTGICVWYRTEAVTPGHGWLRHCTSISKEHVAPLPARPTDGSLASPAANLGRCGRDECRKH